MKDIVEGIFTFIKKNIVSEIIIVVLAAVFAFSGFYSCPFKLLLGIDCPGCGLTRAALALLRLDFAAAFRFNPCIYLLIPVTLYFLLRGLISKKVRNCKKLDEAVLIGTSAVMITVWLVRLWT